jgi:hypothetical protein
MNMHIPPTKGIFHDEPGKTWKTVVVLDYHMGHVNRGDRMAKKFS